MNKWECDVPSCASVAIGNGGAIGLVAIGWWFQRGEYGMGPILYCGFHRPDKIPCLENENEHMCSLCPAEQVAARIQEQLYRR